MLSIDGEKVSSLSERIESSFCYAIKPWHVMVVCSVVAAYCIVNLVTNPTARSGDTLYNYALADSLIEGKGYGTACAQHYLTKFTGRLWLVDSFRAPLGVLFYVPVRFLFPYSSFWACTVLNILVVSFLFPYLSFLLGNEIFSNKQIGLLSAVFLSFHPLFMEAALSCSHDLLLTAFLMGAFLLFLKGLSEPQSFAYCGLLLGLASLIKETAVFWLLAFVCSAVAMWFSRKVRFSKRMLKFSIVGLLLFCGIASIWPIRNRLISQETRIDKTAVGSVATYDNRLWRQGAKIPLWLRWPGQGIGDRFRISSPTRVVESCFKNYIVASVHLFLGVFIPGESDVCFEPEFALPYYGLSFKTLQAIERLVRPEAMRSGERLTDTSEKKPLRNVIRMVLKNVSLAGIIDTFFGRSFYMGLIGFLGLSGLWKFRHNSYIKASSVVLLLVLLAYSMIVYSIVRYYFFHFSLICIIAAGTFLSLDRKWKRLSLICLALSCVIGGMFLFIDWHCPSKGSVPEVKLRLQRDRKDVGLWLNRYPYRDQMMVMCEAPIWLYAYSRVPCVVVPFSPSKDRQLGMLIDVMRTYGVTHVVIPKIETLDSKLFDPLIDTILAGSEWLTPVYQTNSSYVYEVNAEKTPSIQVKSEIIKPEELVQ